MCGGFVPGQDTEDDVEWSRVQHLAVRMNENDAEHVYTIIDLGE